MTPYKAKHKDKLLEITMEKDDLAYGVHRYEGKTLGARWYSIEELERVDASE